MTSLFSPDKSCHGAMLASPSSFFASPPPAFAPCLPLDMQSPFEMPAAQLQSPVAHAARTLRFQPHATMTNAGEIGIGGAFNFAATTQRFNVDIALPRTESQPRPLQLAHPHPHPLLPHHNPELLDGFLLDGGSPMSPLASFATQPAASPGSRKRKSASPSAAGPSSPDECDGELARSASKKSKKHGKSLIDSRNASPIQDTHAQADHTSPLLELLQQSNQTAAPTVAKSKKELRRQKAALKLQRLEASIARLTEQVSATRAQELQATELARQMAAQAAHAAQLANQHLAQRDTEMGMVESFFAEEAAASLPPLSPLSASTANGSGSGSDSNPSSALRIVVSSSSSSSASVSDGGDLSECTTPTLRDRRLIANASPVESLDEAIDAALASAQQQQKQSGHSDGPCRTQVEHLVSLQWEEKARHLRTMQHALHSLEEEVQSGAAHMDSWMGSAETALHFVDGTAGTPDCVHDDDRFDVRAALEQLRAEQCLDQVTNVDLHESIKEFTSVLVAKSRSQHCTFSGRV